MPARMACHSTGDAAWPSPAAQPVDAGEPIRLPPIGPELLCASVLEQDAGVSATINSTMRFAVSLRSSGSISMVHEVAPPFQEGSVHDLIACCHPIRRTSERRLPIADPQTETTHRSMPGTLYRTAERRGSESRIATGRCVRKT